MVKSHPMVIPRASFGAVVRHTDEAREYLYALCPKSSGKLVEALAEAPKQGWYVIDMKRDWVKIFAD